MGDNITGDYIVIIISCNILKIKIKKIKK